MLIVQGLWASGLYGLLESHLPTVVLCIDNGQRMTTKLRSWLVSHSRFPTLLSRCFDVFTTLTPVAYSRYQRPYTLTNPRISPLGADILFSQTNIDFDMVLIHHDSSQSSCIAINDRTFWFGEQVHPRMRTSQLEHFINAELREELRDINWNDLTSVRAEYGLGVKFRA